MVLLTSSTVSAIISAAIISLFTFLLFLVGYVLQQQSVNALREAIKAPPPPVHTPTLPARFRNQENETEIPSVEDEEDIIIQDEIDQLLGQTTSEPSNVIEVESAGPTQQIHQPTTRTESLAYVLALSQPSTLCSAALFARSLNLEPSSTTADESRLVLLYPTTWETVGSPLHIAALTFMRELYDTYPVIYHPVEFVKGWEDASINSHLLGELQRTMWAFDRMMYLRTPGMVVDEKRMANALRKSNIRKAWTPMTAAVGSDPDVLLWERKRGLLMPRGEAGALASREKPSIMETQINDEHQEEEADEPAYILFDSLRGTQEQQKTELYQKYQADLDLVCKGKALLPGEEDRVDLRRA